MDTLEAEAFEPPLPVNITSTHIYRGIASLPANLPQTQESADKPTHIKEANMSALPGLRGTSLLQFSFPLRIWEHAHQPVCLHTCIEQLAFSRRKGRLRQNVISFPALCCIRSTRSTCWRKTSILIEWFNIQRPRKLSFFLLSYVSYPSVLQNRIHL